MNTYRETGKILSILLLVVFIFAVLQPVRSHSPYGSHATYQSHLENLAVTGIPDWQKVSFSVKSPLIGSTWTNFLEPTFTCDALYVSINEFSYFFLTPTINAP